MGKCLCLFHTENVTGAMDSDQMIFFPPALPLSRLIMYFIHVLNKNGSILAWLSSYCEKAISHEMDYLI